MPNDINSLNSYLPSLTTDLLAHFQGFYELLEKYNSKLNLVSKASLPRSGVKHFVDSFVGMELIKPHLSDTHPLYDFGSGNGFPGLIAGLMLPNYRIVLVEKDQRKAEFLKIGASFLELKNVEVYNGKVTDLSNGSCFQVVSRAMAPIPKFLLESREVMQIGGTAFLFKGDHWATEFSSIPAQVFEYWEVDMGSHYVLPENEGSRYIIHCSRV